MTDFRSLRLLASGLLVGGLALGLPSRSSVANAAPDQVAVQAEQVVMVGRTGADISPPGGSTVNIPVEANGAGMIVGQVVDAGSNQPIAGAIVTLGGSFGRGGGGRTISVINGNVSMGGGSSAPTVPRVMTDSEGRFAFRSVPKGSFNLSAQRNGYLDGAYGRHRPNGASQQLSLDDAERVTNLTLRMFRPAVIAGTIVDERGEAVVSAEVRAYRRDLVSGRGQLVPAGVSTRTDDRGIYRLTGLVPGDYVIAVPTVIASAPADFSMQGRIPTDLMSTLSRPGEPLRLNVGGGSQVPGEDRFVLSGGPNGTIAPDADGRLRAYPTVYYPSAASTSTADVITVRSGEERGGVDVTLALRPTANISGRVMGPKGPASMYGLHLVSSDTGEMSTDPSVATTITADDGSFVFLAVPAGTYNIQTVRVPRNIGRVGPEIMGGGGMMVFTATVAGAPAPPPPPPPPPSQAPDEDTTVLWTSTPVSVGDTNVTGLTITLNEGVKVSGRIEFEGSAERPTGDRLRNMVVSVTSADGRPNAALPPARPDDQGRFTLPGLLPGRYLVSAANAPTGWNLKQIMSGNVDVSDVPLEIAQRDVQGVVVTFFDKSSTLTGTVRNAEGRPDDAAAVIVFPSDSRAWRDYGTNPRRMRLVRTTPEGTFVLGMLPTGDYHLIAIADEAAGEWQDPRFLERLSREATTITITEGEKATRELTRRAVQPIGGGPDPAPASSTAHMSHSAAAPMSPSEAADGSDSPIEFPEGAGRGHGPFVSDAPQAQRDARVDPTAPNTGTATVSGIVVLDGETPRPARRARVALRAADQRVERAVMTDDNGRFEITGLPGGRYSVQATKPAHVTGYFGSPRPGRGPGAPLAVSAGQKVTGLTLRIAQGGVISGRILDENGSPFPGATVRLMQYSSASGVRQLMMASAGSSAITTDDRGEYRLYGLTPGAYVVSAMAPSRGSGDIRQLTRDDVQQVVADLKQPTPRVPGGGAAPGPDTTPLGGRSVGFSPTYYPGTSVSAQAVTVNVTAGQEARGIDFALRMVPTATITGVVMGPDGRPAPGVRLMVLQADENVMLISGMTSMVVTGRDGTFATSGLAPGRYSISAQSGGGGMGVTQVGGGGTFVSRTMVEAEAQRGPGPAQPSKPLWARHEADLNGQDLSGVTLQLQEGMTVTGQLVFPRGSIPAPEDLSRVRLMLMPMAQGRLAISPSLPAVDANGAFTIEGLMPGTYRMTATVPSTGFSATSRWSLGAVLVDDRDVLDSGLVVEPGRSLTGLTVTFTDQTSEISGTLTDPAGAPVSDLTILVFSTDKAAWSMGSRRMRPPAQPGSDGVFRFTGLPSGEYFLAAVTDLAQDDWGDPAFMEQVAAAAIRVTVGEGEKKVQDIKLAGG